MKLKIPKENALLVLSSGEIFTSFKLPVTSHKRRNINITITNVTAMLKKKTKNKGDCAQGCNPV